MTKIQRFTIAKWLIGLYVAVIMLFGGLGVMWFMFGWMTNDSTNPWYHVLCFFISMCVLFSYEYWAVRLLDRIADELDI